MYCLVDIKAYSGGRIYAPKGAIVELVKDGDICIFEYQNERFSCLREKLGDIMPIDEIIKTSESGQVNLF